MISGPASRLKAARRACGFRTAAAAAEAFGWSRNTYASNENGNARFSRRAANLYAEAFGVAASWLVDGVGRRNPVWKDCGNVVGAVGLDGPGEVRLHLSLGETLIRMPTFDQVALLVDGEGLAPLISKGSIIYFDPAPRLPLGSHAMRLGMIALSSHRLVFGLVTEERGEISAMALSRDFRWSGHVLWIAPLRALIPPLSVNGIACNHSEYHALNG